MECAYDEYHHATIACYASDGVISLRHQDSRRVPSVAVGSHPTTPNHALRVNMYASCEHCAMGGYHRPCVRLTEQNVREMPTPRLQFAGHISQMSFRQILTIQSGHSIAQLLAHLASCARTRYENSGDANRGASIVYIHVIQPPHQPPRMHHPPLHLSSTFQELHVSCRSARSQTAPTSRAS
jgi:hypothetical protein